MFSIRWKLIGALILVVIVAIGLTAYITDQNTENEFQTYLDRCGMGQSQRLIVAERDFIDNVNRSLIFAGGGAAIVALILGAVLTRRITEPLYKLKIGAKKIASGEFSHRLVPNSRDEIGELSNSFNDMAAKLESIEISREHLFIDIAHELRTPLTVIEGTVEGIKDKVISPDTEHLSIISNQIAILTRITTELRQLALFESGEVKFEFQPTDIVDLIRQKIEEIKLSTQSNSIEFGFSSKDMWLVSIDSGRISQVITNLLSNAIRHSPKSGKVTVEINRTRDEKSELVISVSDEGKGIDSKHIPHLFDRFYRVDSSRDRSEGGIGLGLAIVKHIVEKHGGHVWVDSQLGKGSTFYFSIPMNNPNK